MLDSMMTAVMLVPSQRATAGQGSGTPRASRVYSTPPFKFSLMTFSAKSILAQVPAQTTEFSLRQPDGRPVGVISLDELEVLIEQEMVCGRARGRKLKWIELLVPVGAARRALGDNKSSIRSQASQTSFRQLIDSSRTFLWQHHNGRCFAWQSTMTAKEV